MGEVAADRDLSDVASWAFAAFALLSALAPRPDGPIAGEAKNLPATPMIIGMRSGDTHLDSTGRKTRAAVDRRVEIEMASIALRYNLIESYHEAHRTENAQHLQAFRARVRLDAKARASLHAAVFPGSRFGSGWNNTGWGTGDLGLRLYLKQFYLSARPAGGVEVEWGGLAVAYGESTEITSYDYDGYLTGQRLGVSRPAVLFFDEVSVSLGYLGAGDDPGFFDRLHRLDDVNYGHFLVAKEVFGRARISVDYTRHAGVDTFRQAAHLETPAFVIVDAIRFENYQRRGPDPGYGFNLYGQKKLHPRASLGAGFARIDRTLLNSDRFPRGERVYQNLLFIINPELSVTVAFTRALGSGEAALPRTRLDVALGVNLRKRFERVGSR